MKGDQLRVLREQRGWTQLRTAKVLGVTQAYLSMLEHGQRTAPPHLVKSLIRLFGLPATELPLPPAAPTMSDLDLVEALAALGYAGFRHLAPPSARLRNPAEVLVSALQRPSLAARTVEALPWLALEFSDLNWPWVLREARQHDRQNRLGYVVVLARQLAEKSHRAETAQRLRQVEKQLEPSRLAQEGSFSGAALSEAERRWLRRNRPLEARHWNLLTDMTAENLPHGA